MNLNELKEEYNKLSKKYNLPDFDSINNNFTIEKIDKETFLLLKYVRKIMMEKILNVLDFIEMFVNPINIRPMYAVVLKSMTPEDKKFILDAYSRLSILVISSLEEEIESTEKGEAELIKKIYDEWSSLKDDFKKFLLLIKKPKRIENKRDFSYLG